MSAAAYGSDVIEIGTNRELFVDSFLIDRLEGVQLKLHEPRPAAVAIRYDEPWENEFAFYTTVFKDGDTYRMYYRSSLFVTRNSTCYAESPDGIHWTKPNLGLVEVDGSTANNVVLNNGRQFMPFVDTRPEVPAAERYKANGRDESSPHSLVGYVSADGIEWRRLRKEPIVRTELDNNFDSQNVMFWSEAESRYVLYSRHMEGGRRATARSTSTDFLSWTRQKPMSYSDTGTTVPSAHLYTNQTQPYFRAPHIYISLPARIFFADTRHVVREDDRAAAVRRRYSITPAVRDYFESHVDSRGGGPGDVADAVLLTTRAGSMRFDFTFKESFIRPGIGLNNWTARNNYPACGVVQTGPTEMSLYIHRNYAQKPAHLQRLTLRLDGFTSVHASSVEGQMVTKPFTFTGSQLEINYATSAAGSIRVEIQDADGRPIPGYAMEQCLEIIGDEIARVVAWGNAAPPLTCGIDAKSLEQESTVSAENPVAAWEGHHDLGELAGQSIRLRFLMQDADLYSMRFK